MSGNPEGPIVVGVDGSTSALHAVRWAATEAQQRHLALRLVYTLDDPSLSYPRPLPIREDLHGVLSERGHRILRAARDAAHAVVPELETHLELRHERVAPALLAESESAGLLVLGTWGLRPLGRALIGSATIALAAHAHCPVALIRGRAAEDAPPVDGPVVLGLDGSPASDAAIPLAFDRASRRGGQLTVIHAWDDVFLSALFEETRWTLDRPAVEQHEHELLIERLAGWQEKYTGVDVERVVLRGRPAEQLLHAAEHAQLLVVGSRGRGGLAGMLLGSTSQTVMFHAPCPVIVARSPRSDG